MKNTGKQSKATKSLCTPDFPALLGVLILLSCMAAGVFNSSLRFANVVHFMCWLCIAMATGQAWACRRALFHLTLHCAWCLENFSKELSVY